MPLAEHLRELLKQDLDPSHTGVDLSDLCERRRFLCRQILTATQHQPNCSSQLHPSGGSLDRWLPTSCLSQQLHDMIMMILDSKGSMNHQRHTTRCPDISSKAITL